MPRLSWKDCPSGGVLSKQGPFLFLYCGCLHDRVFFSKDDNHLRGKISLLLSRELPH